MKKTMNGKKLKKYRENLYGCVFDSVPDYEFPDTWKEEETTVNFNSTFPSTMCAQIHLFNILENTIPTFFCMMISLIG